MKDRLENTAGHTTEGFEVKKGVTVVHGADSTVAIDVTCCKQFLVESIE